MSAVDQSLAREYFEMLGFLVRQHRKYVVQAREKTADEEIDLIVLNPEPTPGTLPASFEMTSDDLRAVRRAVVVVKGWHTEIFTPSVLRNPDIFKFVEKETIKEAEKVLGTDGPLLKLLIVPALPASETQKQQSIEMLKARGVDGVLSFRAMLLDLIAHIETNKNYAQSDMLQILRLLKNYDLIKESQLELFGNKRRKRVVKQ
ncbi:MAG: hypothetical protein EXS18_01595 [Verrucomicrobiae bacterium]|nr:hypothetical protein [Verrucomicrobiae bacterium]